MTPKEYRLLFALIEAAARAAYKLGREDEAEEKPSRDQEFAMDVGKQLLIKKEINKIMKKR